MSPSSEEFDGDKQCRCSVNGDGQRNGDDNEQCDFDNDELWNYRPLKSRNLKRDPAPPNTHREGHAPPHSSAPDSGPVPWKRSRESDAAPHNVSPESMQAPWQQSKGHRPFVDNVATAELSKKSALAPSRLSGPPAPSSGMRYGIALPLVSAVLIMAGFAGYKFGSDAQVSLPQPAPRFSQSDQSLLTSEKSLQNAMPSKSDDAPSTKFESRRLDTRSVATKMQTGVELMTFGEVAAARVIFERAAEAGEGTGAFKLAETYDPLVLRALRLQERITPDLALAHTWYEKARDLGSLEAEERISRLTQLPH
jgi:hypothetical protein